MSSYKVFKDSSRFTRTSLVSEVAGIEKSSCPQATAVVESNKETVEGVSPSTVSRQQAELNIEAIKSESYALGKQEAEQAIASDLHQAVDAFTCACTEINSLHKNLLEQSRGDTINLVMALSRKIVGRELQTDREAIVRTLQEAIEISLNSSEYEIWLNPDDFETVEKMTKSIREKFSSLKQIRLKTDPAVSRGGCRLESSICTVDATIEAQMEIVGAFLKEHLQDNRNQKTEDRRQVAKASDKGR